MEVYNRIMVMLTPSQGLPEKLIETAKSLMADEHAQIRLIYVLPSTYITALNFKMQKAKQTLNRLGKQFDIPIQEQKVRIGRPRVIIGKEAEKMRCGLIIVGNRRQQVSDLKLLPGNSGIPVLSVRTGRRSLVKRAKAFSFAPVFYTL